LGAPSNFSFRSCVFLAHVACSSQSERATVWKHFSTHFVDKVLRSSRESTFSLATARKSQALSGSTFSLANFTYVSSPALGPWKKPRLADQKIAASSPISFGWVQDLESLIFLRLIAVRPYRSSLPSSTRLVLLFLFRLRTLA